MSQTYSISAVTEQSYQIPNSDDKVGIKNFIEINDNKKFVAVQGLGFVGTVMSLVVANSDQGEYAVFGVDMASEKAIVDLLLTLQQEGKTIFVVHHDLQSAMEYFDWMVLINKRIVASGPTKDVYTTELLQKTYGGNLSILEQLGEVYKQRQFPIRE